MIVNPATGALVRDPATGLVLDAGADVDPTEPYFARLLADRDLVPPNAEPIAKDGPADSSEDAA